MRDVLGWTPWSGQDRILSDVARSYRAQFERQGFERGELSADDLRARAWARFEAAAEAGTPAMDVDAAGGFRPVWMPGDPMPAFIFRIESGHGFGKTKLVAGVVSHAFDTFPSMAAHVYGTDWAALRDKPMREVFEDRRGKGLPGRMLEGTLRVHISNSHFIQARSTSDAKGKGKDRLHGQHPAFWCIAVDEADAVEGFVFDAIDANTTGGIGVVLLIGNPRRRSSRFAKMKGKPGVVSYRFSTHEHPNVEQGREIIPNAVGREWVRKMIGQHCQVVSKDDPKVNTFRLEWYTVEGADGEQYSPWLEPDDEYRYMVMGIPPLGQTENTFVAPGVYDAAVARGQGTAHGATRFGYDGFTAAEDVPELYGVPDGTEDHPGRLTLGIDVARWGGDKATVYARFRRRVWRVAALAQSDTAAILGAVDMAVRDCRAIAARPFAMLVGDDGTERPVHFPLTSVVARVDNTGGGGTGVVDFLPATAGTDREGLRVESVEVNFSANANGQDVDGETDARKAYADIVTQLYAFAAEALNDLRLGGAGKLVPDTLEADLTDRRYGYRKKGALERKVMEAKDKFKERHEERSPDDGDGFVLCVGHDSAFAGCRRATSGMGGASAGGIG